MPPFSTTIYTRFNDADPAGLVYFANTISLAHVGYERFISDRIVEFDHWFKNKQYDIPIRHCECEYFKPLFPGRDVPVTVDLIKIGNSSITFSIKLLDLNGETAAVVNLTSVFVSRSTGKSIAIPESLRHLLQAQLTAN